jgi:hypothetical protein
MGSLMDSWLDEHMDGFEDEEVGRCINKNGQVDEWIDGQMEGWMD